MSDMFEVPGDRLRQLRDAEKNVVEIAFQAAGAASVPFMRDHPKYVMPSEEIADGVRRVLADHGITDLPEGYREPVSSVLRDVEKERDG